MYSVPQLAGGGGEAEPAQPLAVGAEPGEAGGRSGDQGEAEPACGPHIYLSIYLER